MSIKFYQVDFAQMSGSEIKYMGIINIQTSKTITKALLKDQVQQYLNDPEANIVISHISKLSKSEFDSSSIKKLL